MNNGFTCPLPSPVTCESTHRLTMSSDTSQARRRSSDSNAESSFSNTGLVHVFDQVRQGTSNTEDVSNADTAEVNHSDEYTPNHQLGYPILNTSWQQELAASRVGRSSRASSIFSTRTPLTVLSDDARSINIEAGGQSFRISRDGSYITNTTGAPPPYPGPPLENLTEDSGEEDEASSYVSGSSTDTVRHENIEPNTSASSAAQSLPLRTHLPPGVVHEGPSPENRQSGFNIQQILKSAIQSRWYGTSVRPQSSRQEDIADPEHPQPKSDLRRTLSESSGMPRLRPSKSFSAWPIAHTDSDREEDGAMSSPFLDAERQMQHLQWNYTPESLDNDDDSTAELSRYYNRIMRDMDREHRKRLHERDTELARLRELLNEKDVIYRQQLRERDHTIDSLNEKVNYRDVTVNELKKNAYNLENDMQIKLEKARNEIEVCTDLLLCQFQANNTKDIWEKRWKEYEALLIEKVAPAMSRKNSVVRKNAEDSIESATEQQPDLQATDHSREPSRKGRGRGGRGGRPGRGRRE